MPSSRHRGILFSCPASRTEKGVDLLLTKRDSERIRPFFQVKACVHIPAHRQSVKRKNRRFAYYTWFNCFDVSPQADYFILFGLYAPGTEHVERVKRSHGGNPCTWSSRTDKCPSSWRTSRPRVGNRIVCSASARYTSEVLLTRGSQSGTHTDSRRICSRQQLEGVADRFFIK